MRSGRPRAGRDRRARATGQKAAQGSPENHAMFVIPAKAGIHLSPDPQWVPAFAGTTLICIRSGGRSAHDGSSLSRLLTFATAKSGEQSENVYENKGRGPEVEESRSGRPGPDRKSRPSGRRPKTGTASRPPTIERNKARMSMKTKDAGGRICADPLTRLATLATLSPKGARGWSILMRGRALEFEAGKPVASEKPRTANAAVRATYMFQSMISVADHYGEVLPLVTPPFCYGSRILYLRLGAGWGYMAA